MELRRTIDEKDSLYERLEQAMGRYMTAERKLDRAKSAQVAKLEKQATMGGNADNVSPTTSKAAATPKRENTETNGELENGIASAEAEAARKEAVAAAEKQRAQLEEIEAENERLTNDLSAARTKLASLSDDDYAQSSLFKTLRAQYEDVVKRANDLEASNGQLREDTQKFAGERTAYRTQIDDENRSQINEIESASARAETDLARIRHVRDQLSSEIAILKSSEENSRSSVAQARELAEAKDQRISALESQVKRLELQIGEAEAADGDLDSLDIEALKSKLRTLDNQYSLLSNELPSMESAWKKTQALASKKVEEIAGWEEQLGRLSAEKAKADQKYFAAMKAKDMRDSELRALKSQNSRSSEIVTQLKDGEAKTKELCANYERQLADAKESLTKLETQSRTAEQKLKEATISADGLRKSVDELKAIISVKDKDNLTAAKAKRQAEEELEKCKARLEDSKKQYETLRKSRAAVNATDSDDWRVSFGKLHFVGKGRNTDPITESCHLPCLQRQHSQHRAQTLRSRLLSLLRQGFDLKSFEEVSQLRTRLRQQRSNVDRPYMRTWNFWVSLYDLPPDSLAQLHMQRGLNQQNLDPVTYRRPTRARQSLLRTKSKTV